MARSKRNKASLRAVEEWVGGTVTMPNYVMEETPYRPEAVFWLDTTHDLVVGSDLFEPGVTPAVCLEVLLESMQQPLAGRPKQPTSIRVSDPAVAELVRESVGKEIQVTVAPTPELDRLVELMAASMPKEDEPSYFEDGRVSIENVELFFRAAAELWRAAPWELVLDSHLVRLDCPDLGAEGKCISIIGNLGESFGLLVFDSIEAFEAMTRHGEAMMAGEPVRDIGGSVFSINFELGSDIPKSMRREVAKHGWEVPGANAYPRIQWIDRDKLLRPLADQDVVFAAACCQAITRFFERHLVDLDEEIFESATEQLVLGELPGKPAAEITAPYPGVVWRHDSDDEDDSELDAELAIGREVVEAFVQTEAAKGRDQGWLDAASFICESLYRFKVFHIDGVARGWTAVLVDSYLLAYFPQQVSVDEDLTRETPDIVAAFFAWLQAQGSINARTGGAIQKRIAAKRKRFLREAHDPSNFGPAKAMAMAMMEAGVDPSDPDQVNEFITAQQAMLAAALERE